jgi:uncharacterized protein with GYD domain
VVRCIVGPPQADQTCQLTKRHSTPVRAAPREIGSAHPTARRGPRMDRALDRGRLYDEPRRSTAITRRYVVLIDWTEQGVRNFKDSVDRYEAANTQLEGLEVRFHDTYWTLGSHDIVSIVDAPDDESLAAGLLAVAGAGNIRTDTPFGRSARTR